LPGGREFIHVAAVLFLILTHCLPAANMVKDSRILPDGIIENFDAGATPKEIGEQIHDGLGTERARRIIEYALTHVRPPEPHT
jgi:hypothetical protein